MNRRAFVAAAGTGLGAVAAGCLGDDPDNEGPDDDTGEGSSDEGSDNAEEEREESTDDREDAPGNVADPTEDPDDTAYTVWLENDPVEDVSEFATLRVELVDPFVEPESPAALEATLTNTTDETIAVASGAPSPFGVLGAVPDDGEESMTLWNDAYEESSHVGTDGKGVEGIDDVELLEEFEAGEPITQIFEIHEETPNLEPGSYETPITPSIASDEDGMGDPEETEGLEVALALTVEDGLGPNDEDRDETPEEPRVDDPPYEIDEPERPDDPSEDDDWNEGYLGEGMSEEPSLKFEELDGIRFETLALSIEDDEGDQYALDLVGSREGLEDRFDLDAMEREDRERVEAVDFDEQAVVVVESGFGSGSVHHRWKRVEESEEGVHLHGYYTQPLEPTMDYTSRASAIAVERPDDAVELARASLIVSSDRRVRFDSTDGVVAVGPEDE